MLAGDERDLIRAGAAPRQRQDQASRAHHHSHRNLFAIVSSSGSWILHRRRMRAAPPGRVHRRRACGRHPVRPIAASTSCRLRGPCRARCAGCEPIPPRAPRFVDIGCAAAVRKIIGSATLASVDDARQDFTAFGVVQLGQQRHLARGDGVLPRYPGRRDVRRVPQEIDDLDLDPKHVRPGRVGEL